MREATIIIVTILCVLHMKTESLIKQQLLHIVLCVYIPKPKEENYTKRLYNFTETGTLLLFVFCRLHMVHTHTHIYILIFALKLFQA